MPATNGWVSVSVSGTKKGNQRKASPAHTCQTHWGRKMLFWKIYYWDDHVWYIILSVAQVCRILEDKNLSKTAFNPFSSIFCPWALDLLPSFSPLPLQQDLPFHLVSSWKWIDRLKDDYNYVSSKRLTWRTWCRRRPDREWRWSHRWELAGQSCPPPQCSCLLETFDPFSELFHTFPFLAQDMAFRKLVESDWDHLSVVGCRAGGAPVWIDVTDK